MSMVTTELERREISSKNGIHRIVPTAVRTFIAVEMRNVTTRVLRPRNASKWPLKQRKMKNPNKATTKGTSFFEQAPPGRAIKLLRRSWSQI